MKALSKRSLLISFLAVFAASFLFLGASVNAVLAGETAPDIAGEFEMETGASVRTVVPTGLRFTTKVGNDFWTNLKAAYPETTHTYKFGTLLSIDGEEDLDVEATKWVGEEENEYRTVIMNIPSTEYDTQVTAKSYVRVYSEDNLVYSQEVKNPQTRSAAQVSSFALNNGEIADVLNDYLTPVAQSVSLDYISAQLAEKSQIALIASTVPQNYGVVWSSDNTTVATIDNSGNVTAKSAGVANITATFGDKTATCEIIVENENLYCGKTSTEFYEVEAEDANAVSLNGVALSSDAVTATGVKVEKSALNAKSGANIIDITTSTGKIRRELYVITERVDFEDGKTSPIIASYDPAYTSMQIETKDGNNIFGNGTTASSQTTDIKLTYDYVKMVFDDETTQYLALDFYINQKLRRASYFNVGLITTDLVTEYKGTSVIIRNFGTHYTMYIPRSTYDGQVAKGKITNDDCNLSFQAFDEENVWTKLSGIYLDNFRPLTQLESIEALVIDYEIGYAPNCIRADTLNLTLMENNSIQGNYLFGAASDIYHGTFIVDKEYLDLVFANAAVTALAFTLETDVKLLSYRIQPCEGSSRYGSERQVNVNATGKIEVTVTRADYEQASELNKDLMVRTYRQKPMVTTNYLYFDNFHAVIPE